MILRFLLVVLIAHELRVTRAAGCGPPHRVENTVPIQGTFPPNHKLRYQCAYGFKRVAGTSNLITCKSNGTHYEWFTKLPLICTASWKITTTPSTTSREHKISTGTPPPSVEKNTTHVTTSGKLHTTYNLAPNAISRTTSRDTSTSITFPGTTVTATTTTTTTTTTATTTTTTTTTTTEVAIWEKNETSTGSINPPSTASTGSYDHLSSSPSHSSPLDQWFDQTRYRQPAVVSGSVAAVVIFLLLMGLLLFLYTKRRPLLPCCRNRQHSSSTMGTEDMSERVAMETQPNTESHPNSSTPLFEQEVATS